jgi:hypothetical protein
MSKKRLPLEKIGEYKEVDPVSGTPVTRQELRRGILKIEISQHEDLHAALTDLSNFDPREGLENYRNEARQILRKAGLPTDEDHGEVRLADGRIVPNDSDEAKAMLPGTSYKRWSKIVDERTEQLSPEKLAMKLIHHLNIILNSNYDTDQLWRICALLGASRQFEFGVRGINEAVIGGQKSEGGRRRGPEAKKEQAHEREDVIRTILADYLRTNPYLLTTLSPRTLKPRKAALVAKAIEDAVNKRLQQDSLGTLERDRITYYVKKIDRERTLS